MISKYKLSCFFAFISSLFTGSVTFHKQTHKIVDNS